MTLWARQFRLGKSIDFAKHVVFTVSNATLHLPHKKSFADTTHDDREDLVTESKIACSRQTWTRTGEAAINMSIASWNTSIYQYTRYADLVSYVNFKKPSLSLVTSAFVSDPTSTACVYDASKDAVHQQVTWDEEELCFTQGRECNVWVGSSGWLYMDGTGAAAQYGIRIWPSWRVYGTRIELVIEDKKYFSVRRLTGDAKFDPAITVDTRPGYEVKNLRLKSGGALRFYTTGGYLQRNLVCYNAEIDAGAVVIMDMSGAFSAVGQKYMESPHYNSTTGHLDFKFPNLIKSTFSLASEIFASAMKLELAYLPGPATFEYAPGSAKFTFDSVSDAVSLTFSVRHKNVAVVVTQGPTMSGDTQAPTTTAAPTTSTTTVAATPMPPPPDCSSIADCSGAGVCIADNQCMCIDGFVPHSTLGCISQEVLDTTLVPPVETVAVVTDATDAATIRVVTKPIETVPPTQRPGAPQTSFEDRTPAPKPLVTSDASTIAASLAVAAAALVARF